MRTAELIEDNAQQALDLLIRYATSSRASISFVALLILTSYSGGGAKSPITQLYHIVDT